MDASRDSSAGSLERGLAGDYQLNLGSWLAEAWGRVDGNKGVIWMAMLFYIGLAFLIGMFFGILNTSPVDPGTVQPPSLIELIGNIVSALVLMPMAVGLGFLATAVAMGHRPNPKSLFAWYDKTLKIFLTAVLMNILIFVGLLLLVLPGIYLAVSYQIALPLMVDKKLGPWQALEASRKIIGHCWFRVLAFDVIAAVVIMLSTLLLGIPLIWAVPALVIAFGILYRNLAGIEEDTLARVLAS
ncbi:hypothetical protein [Seongchinamella sediminis]|nr:hypothetical protein [Seongchinamella sediminis]